MKKRKLLAGITAACMMFTAVFPAMGMSAAAKEETTIKAGSFNLAACRNSTVAELNEVMKKHEIEIAGVQEVDKNTSRNPIDMLDEFEKQGYFTDSYFQKTIDFGGGEYGIGILSTDTLSEKSGDALFSEGIDEPRAYSRAVITKDGKDIAFYSTHLTHEDQDVRQEQLAQVLEIMDNDPTPYKILTGDFNTDTSIKESYPMMENYNIVNGYNGEWLDTYNGDDVACKAIDNIVVSRNIEIVSKGIEKGDSSDHNLLYAELKLLDKEVPSDQLLNQLITDAKALKEEDYSEAAIRALEKAIEDAQNASRTSQAAIDEACENLKDVLEALGSVNAVWTMDEGEGQTITDTTNIYTGTLHGGVSWTEGKYHTGLAFDGTGYVDTGIKEDLEGNWTIGMWVNRGEHTGSNTILVSGNAGELKLEQWNNTGKVGVTEFGVGDYTFDYSAPIGEWVHLAFVDDGNGITLYVNGEETDHLNVSINGPVSGIGANSEEAAAGDEGGYLVGKMDELKIYNRALNADEIAKMMESSNEPVTPGKVSTAVLEYAIELAGKADTEGIIPMIAKEFETRLAAANEILDRVNGGDTEVTQEEVDNAWKALIDIMQYLEFKQGDKTDLEKVIAFAESLDMNDYEDDEKMDAFLEALDEARAVRDDENAMQKEIDNAWMALLKATAELNRKLADMTDLNKVIEWTSALDLDKYLEEGQEEFKAALEAAKEVAGDILSTQREVDSAWKTLMDAASALRLKPDKSALDELLQTAESYMAKEGEYEAAAFAAFRTAYADAAAVFENEQATADEVRTAQKNLGDAITNLDDSIAKTDEKAEFIANAGASTTSDTIKKDVAGTKTTEVKSAKTGDMANPAIFAAAIVMAACAAAMAGVKRKHR
ncbi:LamG-like jellyroll fold domain-containing protein [Lachnoclostridium sp. An181]|uniref:LamG-like jellyroll fold domain-containing protein n=1 Tax=Lachnoclostridium sp. An181 TaxID=1965575 RepID=UPI000B39C133|nr:LamG-like jellyroll fold domain-containing protein [Lachnoclostridium sp. An181]OUP49397.1 hypothetical protein B5F18_08330 [Lachnoclostridium sp. An181]